MANNFLRLYKGITDEHEKRPGVVRRSIRLELDHTDMTHESERRLVLHKLGYEVGIKKEARLQRNWNHGKQARERNDKSKLGDDNNQEPAINFKEWRRDYANKLIEINHLTARDKAMKEAVAAKRRIPMTLWTQYGIDIHAPKVVEDITSNNNNNNLANSPSNKRHGQLPSLLGSPSSTRGKSVVYIPVHDVENGMPMFRESTLSKATNQWSELEKKRINDLYWDINKPKTDSPVAWDVYYQIFVARFLESFPHREVSEVKKKIQSMLTKRQLKVQGEEEYWSTLRKNSAHLKSKEKDPFLFPLKSNTAGGNPTIRRPKNLANVSTAPSNNDNITTTSATTSSNNNENNNNNNKIIRSTTMNETTKAVKGVKAVAFSS